MTDAELLNLAIRMREAQRAYYRGGKVHSALVAAKQLEAEFDKAVTQRAHQ